MEITTPFSDRFIAHKLYKDIAQTGDILFRKSDARGPLGLPFMRIVARLTKSEFTHAAVVYINGLGEIKVFEVTDVGTLDLRFIDWLEFCLDKTFEVYRLKDQISHGKKLEIEQNIMAYLDHDMSYDYSFVDKDKFYCTESVASVYELSGFTLCQPRSIQEVCGPLVSKLVRIGNKFYSWLCGGLASLPDDGKFYFVGNPDNGGLMASPLLTRVFRYAPSVSSACPTVNSAEVCRKH